MNIVRFRRSIRFLPGVLAVIIGSLLFAAPAETANPTATLRVFPPDGNVNIGEEIPVDFRLDTGGQAVGGVGVVVSYDAALLEFVSFDAAGSVFSVAVLDPVPTANPFAFERVRFDNGFNGSNGQLMRVTFRAKAEGTAAVTINQGASQVIAFSDSSNILSGVSNGSYVIGGGGNTPPTITVPGPQTVTAGDTLTFTVRGDDADGDAMTLRKISGPGSFTVAFLGSLIFVAGIGIAGQSRKKQILFIAIGGALLLLTVGLLNPSMLRSLRGQLIPMATTVNGTFTWTPAANDAGNHTVVFEASDGRDVSTVPVDITVTARLNRVPVANDQTVTTNEDAAKSITLTASDVENDPLTFSIVTGPVNGALSGIAPNVTYTPNGNFNGPDSFTFKANDGAADSNIATVSITVTSVNDSPLANNQSVTTEEDTAKGITLTASDADGDALTYAIVTQPVNGALSGIAPNVTYTPNGNFNGPDSFTFKANDGKEDSAAATVSIAVAPVNDPPVASGQSVTTEEDTPRPITLTASDPDGDPLTYVIVTQPVNGTLSGDAPNVTYTPNGNFNGPDSFTFKANDGAADSNIATVTISVGVSNDPPLANDQTVTTNEDTAKSITLTASDLDGDTLTFVIVTQPVNGALSGNAPNVTYTPNGNFNGADSFTFKANDGKEDSNTATVSIAVTPVNDPPVASDQTVTTNEDTAKPITLTASDADGNALTYVIVTQPVSGTLAGSAPNLTYTPRGNFNGPDSFTFRANDGAADSNTATVSITVTPVNDPPVASDQTVTTNEDTAKSITLTASDADGDALAYAIVTQPVNGTLAGSAPNVTYTPNGNFAGSDSFTFKANDGAADSNVATVSIEVAPSGSPVFTFVPGAQSVVAGNLLTFTVTASDPNGDDITLTMSGIGDADFIVALLLFSSPLFLIGGIAFGGRNRKRAIFIVAAAVIVILVIASAQLLPGERFLGQLLPRGAGEVTGTFSWTPDDEDIGAHTAVFTASDGTNTATATVTIVVLSSDVTPPPPPTGGPSCGDGVCSGSENCANCDADCACGDGMYCEETVCVPRGGTGIGGGRRGIGGRGGEEYARDLRWDVVLRKLLSTIYAYIRTPEGPVQVAERPPYEEPIHGAAPVPAPAPAPLGAARCIVPVTDEELPRAVMAYRDVPADAWFARDVASIARAGIVFAHGYERGADRELYGPEDPVTYAELARAMRALAPGMEMKNLTVYGKGPDEDAPVSRSAVMQTILEALEMPVDESAANPYSDLSPRHPHAGAIVTLTALGIVRGDGALLRPDDPMTHAEIAAVIARVGAMGCED